MGLAPFDVAPTPPTNSNVEGGDVEMDAAGSSMTRAEAEVARMANIILFPDRYDFYMAKRNSNGTKRSKVKVERGEDGEELGKGKGKGKERERS